MMFAHRNGMMPPGRELRWPMDLCHRRWWLVKPSGSVRLVSGACFRGEFDAVGIVNETVQDGVGIGRIADYFVPSVYWKLEVIIVERRP